MTWQPIETAPKGKTIKRKTDKSVMDVFIPEKVHTWRKDGHETISYYLPDEDRWVGYTKEAGPDMWHPFPKPPKELK